MYLLKLQQVCFALLCAAVISFACCSPSPKYCKHPRTRKEPRPVVEEKTGDVSHAPIKFSPPVHHYRASRINSYFGVRRHPRYHTREFHQGIDISVGDGEEVLASAPGTVIFAGRQRGFGKVVIIDHGSRFCTVYAHLSVLHVTERVRVERGEVLGKVGKTGNATGIHLHFEIRKASKAQNPLDYL